MKHQIQAAVGCAGYFQFTKHKADADGNPIPGTAVEYPWFPNLITDQGLERMGTHNYYFLYCQVGSGNTPPDVTDTGLETWIAGVAYTTGATNSTQPSSPYYAATTGTYRFPAGVATGNISEVGVGWGTDGSTLFSRALILDGGGNPTTITVLSDEILDVTYQFRVYPPESDTSGSITISGNSYSYTARAAKVTTYAGQFGEGWGMGFGGGQMALRESNVSHGYAFTGTLGAITSAPSGSQAQRTSQSAAAYVPANLYVEGTLIWSISANNIGSYQSVSVAFTGCVFQVQYDPVIPKTTINELQLTFRVAWSRATIP